MTTRRVSLMALPALALLLAAAPASAQDVRAEIRIGTGPISGRVVIGERRHIPARVVVVDRAPRRAERVIVERRGARRIIVVDEDRRRVLREHGRHDRRHVRGYWDPRTNEFYFERWHPRLRPVVFCEHGNRYHLIEGWYDDRYDRSRWDDRGDDREDHRRDGRRRG